MTTCGPSTKPVSFNVGADYSVNQWIHPYVSFSNSYQPPPVSAADAYGNPPATAHGVGEEAGLRIRQYEQDPFRRSPSTTTPRRTRST